ncbi:1,4-beta-N-acetylmuramidase [Bifidobacterium rousetti]|uniref:RICIN domain-containing protein n=1 Tax=Bifidobacterium rousetti TaxID=2045439 RepID=UPI001238A90B|nr:RICIN domain-containing protein [Bifidobacterium rousetti]KAA8818887.1 1,4-beta-N-acetylmuramidase [Bifidobacterium rousetti]
MPIRTTGDGRTGDGNKTGADRRFGTRALKLVAAVSATVMAVSFAAPAFAQPLRDTAINPINPVNPQSQPTTIQAQTSATADVAADEAMPGNPSVELPDKVASSIPNSATVVSEDHAVTTDGKLKDIETGKTVTDPKLVGTASKQPDPLTKTDGESFIPVDVKDVKTAVKDAAKGESGASGESGAQGDNAAASTAASTTDGTVTPAALGNNEYGAHWGNYNGMQAFFDAGNNVFAKNAKGVVDVSEWQNTIDWQAAKAAGVEGAIVRIGYGWGNGFDKQAQRNISELKRLGLPFGIYLYSYAYDTDTAAKEGANVVNLLKKAGVSPSDLAYPVYYDLEAWSWAGHAHPTDPNVYNAIVNAWYGQLQSAGYNNLSVYSYTSYLNGPLNNANIHAKTHWVAQYGGYMGFQNWSTKVRGWQYTSGGSVAGMSGRIDLNAFGTTDGSPAAGGNGNSGFSVTQLDQVTIPNGTYYINSGLKDSSSVEIPGASTANGAATKLYGYNGTKAQQFTFTKQSDGTYEIRNANSNKALDVAAGAAGNGATVQQYDANGSKAQRWILRDAGNGYYIQSALGNFVLDVAGASTANGTQVRLWTPNGSDAQTFITPSAGVAVPGSDVMTAITSAVDSKKVVDVPGASTADGARLQVYDSNDSMAQRFRFAQIGNGVYEIVNVNSNKVLEVANGSYMDEAPVQQRTSDGSRRQHWQVRAAGNGNVTLLSGLSNKALDIPAGNAANGVQLWVYTYNGSAAQQWKLDKEKSLRDVLDAAAASHKGDLADGTYTIASAAKQSMVLDVNGGSKANYGNVQIYTSNGTPAQRWKVTHDAKGYVTFTNVGSGKVLDVNGGSADNGANVQQYSSNGSWAQKWIAVKNSDGTLTFQSAVTGQRVIDVWAGATANGTNVQVYASNGTNAQKWVVK